MKILVIDDHPLIQNALAELLPQIDPKIEVRGAASAAQATAILDNEPDVALVLLDLALPGTRGLDLLGDLLLDYPGVPVVVLSATHDHATVMAARAAGARGFIAKTADPSALLDAVRQVLEGNTCLLGERSSEPDGDGVHIRPDALGLTARQTDVLKLLARGMPNKLICRDLKLSEGTVKVHVSAILKALNVRSRTEAIATLARRGISVDALKNRPIDP